MVLEVFVDKKRMLLSIAEAKTTSIMKTVLNHAMHWRIKHAWLIEIIYLQLWSYNSNVFWVISLYCFLIICIVYYIYMYIYTHARTHNNMIDVSSSWFIGYCNRSSMRVIVVLFKSRKFMLCCLSCNIFQNLFANYDNFDNLSVVL